jgi:hypothetical protein
MGAARIPPADIDGVGLVKYKRTTLVGLRLRNTERFIASFTDEERAALSRSAKRLRVFARSTAAAQLGTLLSTVDGLIAFARKHFGYDWTIGALELDRSPAQSVVPNVPGFDEIEYLAGPEVSCERGHES